MQWTGRVNNKHFEYNFREPINKIQDDLLPQLFEIDVELDEVDGVQVPPLDFDFFYYDHPKQKKRFWMGYLTSQYFYFSNKFFKQMLHFLSSKYIFFSLEGKPGIGY